MPPSTHPDSGAVDVEHGTVEPLVDARDDMRKRIEFAVKLNGIVFLIYLFLALFSALQLDDNKCGSRDNIWQYTFAGLCAATILDGFFILAGRLQILPGFLRLKSYYHTQLFLVLWLGCVVGRTVYLVKEHQSARDKVLIWGIFGALDLTFLSLILRKLDSIAD